MKKLLSIFLIIPFFGFTQDIVNPNWICGEPFVDHRDGKEYLTTLIGNQCWFSENLQYVPTYGYDPFQEWYINRDNGYYWVYNDSIGIVDSLGIYYSSDVIINTEICPSGTRVPSQSDLSDLNSFPGVNSVTLTVGGWTEFNLLENISAYSLNNSHSPSLSANGVVESYYLFYNSNGAGINNSLGTSSATADNLPVRCIVNGSSTNELGTISGCQDFVANNFAPLATEDDSSCTYEIISYNEFMFTNPMPPIIWGYDGITTGATDTYGLINTTVLVDNFNQNQSDNPASICSSLNSFGYSDWYLPSISEMSSFHSFTQDIYESDYYWSSTEENSNSTYVKHLSNTNTYSHLKSTNNPAFCIRKNDYGCIDSTALNYDQYANISDGNCIEKVFGCMDDNAVNYNLNANVGDSSCEYEVVLDNGFYIIPYEISEPMQWGFYGLETNINSSNGFVNTNQLDYIFNTINDTTITPVSYCINMDLFGFDDWYLPSYSEMSQINSSLYNVYPNNTYLWTSTEINSTESYSYRVNNGGYSSNKDYEYNFTCVRKDFFGCTDSTALNFDEVATVDDGNCIEKVFGCMNDNAVNFNSNANVEDSSCEYEVVLDNGFYIIPYEISEPMQWGFYGLETNINSSNGFVNTNQLDYIFNTINDTTITPVSYCINMALFGFDDWYLPSYSEMSQINSSLYNVYPNNTYLWTSTEINSTESYSYRVNGGGYSSNKDYEYNFTCVRKDFFGCTDSTALNFDEVATVDDGNCIEKVFGCMDDNAVNFNSNANVDDSSCGYEVVLDNGFYIIPYALSEPMQWGFYGLETGASSSSDGISNTSILNNLYLSSDQSVTTPASYCVNMELFGFNDWYLPSSSEMSQINSSLYNIYPSNTYLWTSTEVSSTTSYTHRTNSSQYSSQKDYEYDFTCIRKDFFGCTDSTALNYDITATVDDGNCLEKVFGCIDSHAYNYNSMANTEDSSCVYLSSQIVFEEDFNDFYSNLTDIDNSVWEYSTSLNSIVTNTFDSSPFLISQGAYYVGDNNNYVLPIYIDTNNIDSLSLTFDFILGHYAYTDYLYVSNDSLNWIEIGIFNSGNENTNWDSPSEFSIDFSNYINDTIFLRFYRQQYSQNSDYIAIDNIKLWAYNFDLGCSDLEAINYNPLSEINYGDCIYALNVDSVFMNEYQNLNTEYNILVENYEDLYNSSDTGIIFIDLYEGWNMIGYVRSQEQDVVATLQSINSSLEYVKNNNGDVFWPEFGYNSIGNFIPGQGYQMKLKNDELDFFFPFVDGLRIDLNPTVPLWAIDMEVEMHPNDIRTLVRVVNMLGQEVVPSDQFTGEVLIYMFNDGTIEKKIGE